MRNKNELRKITIEKNYTKYAEGSVLISYGDTKVLCNCSIDTKLPSWLKGKEKGWINAEYSMLPRATHDRTQRESTRGKQTGRTLEISRLIARSLRSSVDLSKIPDLVFTIDCDVIQADGGTRTASITGGFIALSMAINKALEKKLIDTNPIISKVAAISVGIIDNDYYLDLNYELDSNADVDMNIVMNDKLDIIELQGTGEESTYSRKDLNNLLDIAEKGFKEIFKLME